MSAKKSCVYDRKSAENMTPNAVAKPPTTRVVASLVLLGLAPEPVPDAPGLEVPELPVGLGEPDPEAEPVAPGAAGAVMLARAV